MIDGVRIDPLRRITDERGANLVEYVFLLVFIALVVVIAVTALGGKVSEKFSTASSKLG